MGITIRSGYSTQPDDPTFSADNLNLWAIINLPKRLYEIFIWDLWIPTRKKKQKKME